MDTNGKVITSLLQIYNFYCIIALFLSSVFNSIPLLDVILIKDSYKEIRF